MSSPWSNPLPVCFSLEAAVRAFAQVSLTIQYNGARHSSMVQLVVGLILHGGPIELFLVPAGAPQRVTKAMVCAILCYQSERLDRYPIMDLLSYFLFQPVLCNWYNKGYMVCAILSLWWCMYIRTLAANLKE